MKDRYLSFLSENFQFLEVKFSIYLNRCVFVMAYVFQYYSNSFVVNPFCPADQSNTCATSVDRDQTVHKQAVSSGSTLFTILVLILD